MHRFKTKKKVVEDSFPIDQVEVVLGHLGQPKVFSTLDLKSGFFHFPVRKYTKYLAFICHADSFEFLRVLFSLTTSSSVFLRFIYNLFREFII
ncbi:Retrovirus-related Pol polyprotein from transposon gypsy, partial [Stegodyphus mimosarum]